MNGMESVRDLLDGSQRESPVGSIDRFQPGHEGPRPLRATTRRPRGDEPMSIYCSRSVVGKSWFDPDAPGRVVTYPENDLARVERRGWPEGSLHLAHIPHWCVPGHEDGDTCAGGAGDEPVSTWLRLSFNLPGIYADVLLDEDAVRGLRDDLTAWLEYPKAEIRKVKR